MLRTVAAWRHFVISVIEKGSIIMSSITSMRVALATFVSTSVVLVPAVGQTISENFKIIASDGAADDWFGNSVAIGNGIIVVGAVLDDDNGSNSGSIYLFSSIAGTHITKILPDDGQAGDHFGYPVAIDNGIIAIGASLDDDNGFNSGSAYIFDAFTGMQIAKILPNDGMANDEFGFSIAVSKNIIAVGSYADDDLGSGSGSVYLFNASTGEQVAKLLPSDGAAGDNFGWSIGIYDNIVAVGAIWDSDNGSGSGSVYLFDISTGAQVAKLVPSDGNAGDLFGFSIAIANGIVAVGARYDDDNGNASGSVYLFDVLTGTQLVKLLPNDGAASDNFGTSIAINNGLLAVGSSEDDDNGFNSGSAYIFDTSTGLQVSKLLPGDGAAADYFGRYVAISDGSVAVGAYKDDDNGFQSGSAYVFTLETQCLADLTGDGLLNFFDVSAFLTYFQLENPAADFNGDGLFNFFDISAYLIAFVAGCP